MKPAWAWDWDAVLAIATVVLGVIGTWQIIAIRSQGKKERILNAIMRYDSDAIIDGSARKLRAAQNSGDFNTNPEKYRADVVTLLNYLDTIAIGIRQNLYVETIARDHIESVVLTHCPEYLNDSQLKVFGMKLEDYRHLSNLRARWQKTHTHFRDGWIGWSRRVY